MPDAQGWKHKNKEPDLSLFSRGIAIPWINTSSDGHEEMCCSTKY